MTTATVWLTQQAFLNLWPRLILNDIDYRVVVPVPCDALGRMPLRAQMLSLPPLILQSKGSADATRDHGKRRS